MDKSIKTLGLFPIRVSLHAEVDAIVTVNVARSLEEAEKQAKTGQAVVARDDDEDEAEAESAVTADAEDAGEAADASDADTEEDEAN